MLWYPELDRPRLRALEPLPFRHDGEVVIALRDSLGLAQPGLVVPLGVYFLVSQMDGRSSIEEISAKFKGQFQAEIPLTTVQEIVLQLDEAHCLETERFRRHRDERLQAYREAPLRPMAHAGGGYPTDPEKLRRLLDRHFTDDGGPGSLPRPNEGSDVRAIISPHLDFARGGPNYGWSYRALGEGPTPETVIIFGTAHGPCHSPMMFTRKDFDTPLGPVPVERDFIDAVQAKVSHDLFEDEILHITEHSVEFQVVSLRHVFPDAEEMRIVPIICGALHLTAENGGLPKGSQFGETLQAILDTIAEWPRRVTAVAGADLAHIGPQFGDEGPVDQGLLDEVGRLDEEALGLAARGEAEGFLRSFAPTKNARRVCSIACIYAALRCLPALGVEQGRVLNYVQSVDPKGEVCVTHASLVFP